ncbi:hypothetical protein MNBD_DELTA01-78 [hydrothermal vent metagenome]|uniref:Cytochrome c-552/4 domain-containing protein n=1 Tax=hydrothermal vent metagenome TaxID=652676 RepID=A0A3B0RG55_9ZZZZ
MFHEKSLRNEKPLLRILISTLLTVAVAAITCGNGQAAVATPPSVTAAFSSHWERPLRLTKDKIKTPGLLPADCRLCHELQYAPWSRSLHSKSMGPGLMGQLSKDNPDFATSCYFCHAPAKKQNEFILNNGEFTDNTEFDQGLQDSGVSCAICHLRGSVINGPTGGTGSTGGSRNTGNNGSVNSAPHQITKNSIFKDSVFCSACHQLDGGFELNGKSLTNTYREWLDSPYPAKEIHCQNCHMPEAKHLFLGIHDKETVRAALDIKVQKSKKGKKEVITLSLKNTGAGHYLPTYVTPLIVASIYLTDNSGEVIEDSLQKDLIGRVVKLDLSEEVMDSRIAPGGTHTFKYRPNYPKTKKGPFRTVIEVHVYPDDFYNRFFKEALRVGAYNSRALMQEALETTERSPYLLFKEVIELN